MDESNSNRIPAAFGPDRMELVWGKPPLERAKPFWEALEWLAAGSWRGVITAERATELKAGVTDGITRTCAGLAREFEQDKSYLDRTLPQWRANHSPDDDPDCVYRTGIMPPRIACFPDDAPYPTDLQEMSVMHREMSEWSFTPAAAAKFSPEDLENMRSDDELVFREFWRQAVSE